MKTQQQIEKKPKTLEQALEMFDEMFVYKDGIMLLHTADMPVLKSFLETVWHAGRESVVENCEKLKKELLEGVERMKIPNTGNPFESPQGKNWAIFEAIGQNSALEAVEKLINKK